MAHTDKDDPISVTHRDSERVTKYGVFYDLHGGNMISGDSGFRKTRKWLKRHRSKAIRRYVPELNERAKAPYSGLKRTWDFE